VIEVLNEVNFKELKRTILARRYLAYAALPLIVGMGRFSFRSRRNPILTQMNSRMTSSTKAMNKTNPKTTHAVIMAIMPPSPMLLPAWNNAKIELSSWCRWIAIAMANHSF
jgi:hypothetical protein